MDSLFPILCALQSRYLFVDMNAFFAALEQQASAYQNQPLIVVPMRVDATCVIAASDEAKKSGVRTGMPVREARRLCPSVRVVEARPELYLAYHARLVEILSREFPTVEALSAGTIVCRMPPECKTAGAEMEAAQALKQRLAAEMGLCTRSSARAAPSVFLRDDAGMALERQTRKSVGHTYRLPLEHSTLDDAKRLLLELAGRALKRLRACHQLTRGVEITIQYRAAGGTVRPGESSVWTQRSRRHFPANDEHTWLNVVRPLLETAPDKAPFATPWYVTVTFAELSSPSAMRSGQ